MYQVRIVPACPSARLAAWLIDTGITLALLVGTVYWTSHQLSIERFLLTADYRELAIVLLVPTAIQLMILSVTGKTIGMFSMDLQILQADGESATLSNMLRRPIGLIAIAVTGGIIALLPFLNEHRKTIGDLLSGTRVVESMALGTKVGYDPWRVFKGILKPLAPVSLAIALAALLINKNQGPNKEVLLDAVVISAIGTLIFGTVIAGVKVKTSRVRLGPKGIQRSGWLGWSKKLIPWEEVEYALFRPKPLFPCFELHKTNHGKFRVPIEHNSAQLTARELVSHGVRIEQ